MRRLVPALLLALAAAGCEPPAVELDERVVRVRIRDFRYAPQNVSVPSGRILFGVVNEGPEPTNFRIRDGRRDLLDITTLEPGERGLASVRLRPGEYVMYSSVGRHEALGEHGTLVVRRR